MLYKERVIRDQPVDVSYLNAWVSLNQFVAGVLVAPLIFDAKVRNMLASLSCDSLLVGCTSFL